MMGFWDRGLTRYDMMDRFAQHPWASLLIGGICMLIVLAIVIVVIVLLVRMSRRNRMGQSGHTMNTPPPAPMKNSAALALLDERYAKGEIGDEEYNTKKANLLS